MNKNFMIFAVSFLATFYTSMFLNSVHAKEAPKKPEMTCVSNAELDKIMTEKNYDVLLQMTNSEGVVETVWAGGRFIAITAGVPNQDKSCLLAQMTNVTYNPKAIEETWETYKKQTKQKDI